MTATAANRLGLDYHAEAQKFAARPGGIIDIHSHINGSRASAIYQQAAQLYGVRLTYSMTQTQQAAAVREVMGDAIRFIAIPDYMSDDPKTTHTTGFLDNITRFHDEFGARIVKFWNAPRLLDFLTDPDLQDAVGLESPWRIKAAERASELGMMIMTHVADPDTWFKTKYSDASKYGTKLEQYAPLERMLDRFTQPWIAAHMGGWPEDLAFLHGMLERHDNLHLDTSATKWMVRELSTHPSDAIVEFLTRWKGRVLFGSDIVTSDDHLETSDPESIRFAAQLASGEDEAFQLYASRYWALRTMWETDYAGESNIADPDLAMVNPEKYDEMSAPPLRGHAVPDDLLEWLYHRAAEELVLRWEADHP